MGITSKDIQTYLWMFLEFSTRLCCTFVREHPLPSIVSLVLVILYVFLSSVFWFLIYTLPLVLVAGVIVRVVYFPECPKNEKKESVDQKSPGKTSFAEDEEKKKKSIGRAQSVRRRKSKKDFPPYVEEDGSSIFPPMVNEHEVVDKSPLTEENLKDIREVEVHSVSERPECSSSDASQCVDGFTKDWRKTFKIRDESEGEMTDDSEVDDRLGRKKKLGMKWTQEDQKNLMDLSEMERNKRLESLIARRRARRLVSLHVRRTLMNIGSDDPPISIVIPRTNAGSSGPFSPTPGSAPSVLLPNQNPFDLPYDQHEEKPNLRGGSFHQDFMVPHQDLMFCRHESFSLGNSYCGDFSDLPPRHKLFEATEIYRSRTPFSKETADRIIQQVSVQEPKELNKVSTSDVKEQASEEDGSEVQIKSVLIEDIDDRTSSSSSEEEDEPFYRIDKDAILKSLTTPSASRNITIDSPENSLNPGQSMSQKARMEEHYYYANDAMLPTPSHSIASDLQVEVSEIGSPPRSVDGASSLEEEVSVEKDNEGAWVASSCKPDENESRSREVPEQDFVEFGFSNIPPERVIEQYCGNSPSFSPAHDNEESSAPIEENEIIELIRRNSHGKNGAELSISEVIESHDDLDTPYPLEAVMEQARIASLPSPSSPVVVSQSKFLMDQESSSNLDQPVQVEVLEVNVPNVENDTSMAQHSVSPTKTDKTEENSIPDIGEVIESPSERRFSTANQSSHYDPQTTLAIPESVSEQVPDAYSSSASPKSPSKLSMNRDSTEEQQYGFAERRSEEDSGSSMVNQSSNDPESVIGQISTSSSSSSSSRSISQTNLSMDLDSSNLDQETQMEVPQSQEQITETQHARDDISNPITSRESGRLLADPTAHQLLDRTQEREILNTNSIKETESLPELETIAHQSESYNHESSEEASTNNHINPSVIQEDIRNKDSIIETEGLPKLETNTHNSESHDHTNYSEETSSSNTNASLIPEEILNVDSTKEAERMPKSEMATDHLESYNHKNSSEETNSNNHIHAPVIQEKEIQNTDFIKETEGSPELQMTEGYLLQLDAGRGSQGSSTAENEGPKMTEGATHLEGTAQKPAAEVKPDINNDVEGESRTIALNEVSNLNVSKAAEENNDSTYNASFTEKEFPFGQTTPNLSEKPVEEEERKFPNLNIVDEANDKAPNFQGSHEGGSESQGSSSPNSSVNESSQVSELVHPNKVEGEKRIQNEVDTAISSSGGSGNDHGSKDAGKPMNSENATVHLMADKANFGSGEREQNSDTNLKE